MAATIVFKLKSITYPGVEHTGRFGAFTNYYNDDSHLPNSLVTMPHENFVTPSNIFYDDMFVNAGDCAEFYTSFSGSSADYKTGMKVELMAIIGSDYFFSFYNKEFGLGFFARTTQAKGLYLFLGPYASAQLNVVSQQTGNFGKLYKRLKSLWEIKDAAYRATMIQPVYSLFLPYAKILDSSEFTVTNVPEDWDPEGDNPDYFVGCHLITAVPTPQGMYDKTIIGRAVAGLMPGLTSLWNWFLMLYNEPVRKAIYMTDSLTDTKIYLAQSYGTPYRRDNGEIANQSSIRGQIEDNYRDWQAGTNLSALFESGNEVFILNGGLVLSANITYRGNLSGGNRSEDVSLVLSKTVDNVEYKASFQFSDRRQTGADVGVTGIIGDFADAIKATLQGGTLPSSNTWDSGMQGSMAHMYRNAMLTETSLVDEPTTNIPGLIVPCHNRGTEEFPDNPQIGKGLPFCPIGFGAYATLPLGLLNEDSSWGNYMTGTFVVGACYQQYPTSGTTYALGRYISYPLDTNVESIEDWTLLLTGVTASDTSDITPGDDGGGQPPSPEPEGGDTDLENLDSDDIDGIGDTGIPTLGDAFFKMYRFNDEIAIDRLGKIHDWIMSQGFADQRTAQYISYVMSVKQMFTPDGRVPAAIATRDVYIGNEKVKDDDDNAVQGGYLVKFTDTYEVGEIDIEEVYGSALDYAPFTKLSIYLPFCGVNSLNVDEFMGGKLIVSCSVDYISGAITYSIKSSRGLLNSILYNFTGNCGIEYPFTAIDYGNKVSGLVNAAMGIADVGSGIRKANVSKMASGALSYVNGIDDILHAGNAVRTGNLSSNIGLTAHKKPYVIIERPNRKIDPSTYGHMKGYPSNVTVQLGSLTGYTVVKECHLSIPGATASEIAEIEQDLKSGVIL